MPISSLALLLGDVRNATAYRYGAVDSLGNRMDTAKVIQSPVDGYLAVYHSGQVCHLASSGDLMTWTHRAVIDEPATQPTIAMAPDGGLLTAAEFNDGHGGQLRIRYWPTLTALLQGRAGRSSWPHARSAPATKAPRASARSCSALMWTPPRSISACTTTGAAESTGKRTAF